jgi:uncharacterized protein with GYD domain
MIQFMYKPETVGNLLKNPEDRSIAVRKLIEKLGGKMLAFYYSYGDYDGLVKADMPDNISGARYYNGFVCCRRHSQVKNNNPDYC